MRNSGKKATDDDDVEQLLRAAQEDVLLKLSVDSHMARGSAAAAVDSDLDRRFRALKKPQKLNQRADPAKIPPKHAAPPADDGGDDLYARFAALKTSLLSNSGGSIDQKARDETEAEEGEEDEVEKVIKWAIDAARLDPSPPSDDDDDDDDDDNDEGRSNEMESDDDDDDGVHRGKKSKRK